MVDGHGYRRESEISQYSRNPHFGSSNHPSFSSTLLDAIYRSIDQGEEEVVIYREAMRKKQSYGSVDAGANVRGVFKSEEEMANFQRACMIEKWMEKKVSEKVVVRRKSVADLQMKKMRKDRENSSRSSSDSSCGGGFFSSSEAESFPVQMPKPVRTVPPAFEKEKLGKDRRDFDFNRRDRRGFGEELERKPKHEGGFLKTKSRALKIYGDLKKVKQPISPGGKLAGFLNSLFTVGNLKKHKVAANGDESPSLKSANASTCSSASSFSRSCLSKTPSSRGKSSTGVKRSVRFSPVSVILDEDCQPCGQKSLHKETNNSYSQKQTTNFENNNINSIRNVINEELMVHAMEKHRRVEQVARDLLRNYQRKNQAAREFEFSLDHLRNSHSIKNQALDEDFDHDEEDEEDAASCASSDLFELDNLSSIGMERYREELPVYETTHLDTNRAIANGLIL